MSCVCVDKFSVLFCLANHVVVNEQVCAIQMYSEIRFQISDRDQLVIRILPLSVLGINLVVLCTGSPETPEGD